MGHSKNHPHFSRIKMNVQRIGRLSSSNFSKQFLLILSAFRAFVQMSLGTNELRKMASGSELTGRGYLAFSRPGDLSIYTFGETFTGGTTTRRRGSTLFSTLWGGPFSFWKTLGGTASSFNCRLIAVAGSGRKGEHK